jgi:hypothetical protein
VTSGTTNKRPTAKATEQSKKSAATTKVKPMQRLPGQPRLQLDPLDIYSDRIASLDGEMNFDAPPDALESIQKIKTLEDSLQSLRLMAARNEASLSDLQDRLQKSESSGFSSQAGYALIALALMCLAAVAVGAVLWRRQQKAQVAPAWWGGADPVPPVPVVSKKTEPVLDEPAADPVAGEWAESGFSQLRAASGSSPSEFKRSSFGVNVNMTEMSDADFKDFMPTGTLSAGQASKLADLQPSGAPSTRTPRNLNSDAVLDTRQQAEFFVSLGQTERAAQLLRREIKESEEANPFVYLDLLALFHSLGLKGEFQHLRERFELQFCCQIPAFTLFKNRTLDLESYPEALSHIAERWAQPGIFAWLESCIFQSPDKRNGPGFDLAAFRDLLFLHAVARIRAEMPASEGGVSPKVGASTPSAKAQPTPLHQELPPFDALDLDLSSPETGDVKASEPPISLGEPLPFLMPPDLQFDTKVKQP